MSWAVNHKIDCAYKTPDTVYSLLKMLSFAKWQELVSKNESSSVARGGAGVVGTRASQWPEKYAK